MAITEYQKDDKTFFKVYVQCRSRANKRIRLQKVLRGIESLAVARREERKLIRELAENVAKLEGKGLLWSEVMFRWELAGLNGHLGSRLNRYTISDHTNRLKRYTKPWSDLVASDLTKADGRKVINWAKSKGASVTLLKKIKTSINLVYEWGVEEGLIRGNNISANRPVYGIGVDEREESVKPILTIDEVRLFLSKAKSCDHPWYPIWAFAATTGMRSGELMALQWGDIDEQNGVIRVSRSFDKRTKRLKSTKSGSWRNVDINSQLAALISDLRKERGGEEFVLPRFADWSNGAAGKILRAFLKSIGIETVVVFHTLRACFATHLLSMGVEPL